MAMTDSAHGFHYKLGVMLAFNMTENRLRIKSLITGGQIVKEYDPVMQRLKQF
jgi:acetyl/propionyl-CoA carboxylase alpha subunit